MARRRISRRSPRKSSQRYSKKRSTRRSSRRTTSRQSNKKYSSNRTGCHYPNCKDYNGIDLLFTCKFCHNKFCNEHRLPERHNCADLKKYKENVQKYGFTRRHIVPSRSKRSSTRNDERGVSGGFNVKRSTRRKFKKPHIKNRFVRKWKNALVWGAASIGVAYLTNLIQLDFLYWLNPIVWLVFAFYLFKRSFIYMNRLDMSNDLLIWLIRIFGGIFAFIGLYFGLTFTMVNYALGFNDPLAAGLGILALGLGVLGCFMLFRFNRRYRHIYINR